MYFLLLFLFALKGSDANPTQSPNPVCPPSSWVYDEGIYNVDLTIGDPIVIPITIGGPFELQPTDIYFLWDTSAFSREYSFHYWINGSRRLRRVMNKTMQANPGVQFGLGFFRTKRLHNIGVGSDYVFKHAANITSDIVYLQNIFNNSEWSLVAAVSPINSAIEAAQHVMLNAGSFGFRPNARKIIFLATSTMFGQQGNTIVRTSWTVAPLMQLDPGSNSPFLFPRANDGDAVLEDDCTIMGAVCYESVVGAITPCFAQTSVALVAPPTPLLSTTNIVCSCPYTTGNLTKLNITQFHRGSCEDFPSQADIPFAADSAGGFDLFAFLPSDRLDQGIVPIYTALVNSISSNGAVINGTLELGTVLPPLVPQVPDLLQFTVTWNVPEVQNYTIGPCDMNFCTFNFLFVGSIPGQITQLADIFIDSIPFTFNVETCGPTQSFTQTPTYSFSQSNSNSQSRSMSDSQSSSSSQSSTPSFSKSQSRSGTNVRTKSSSQSQSSTMSSSQSQSMSSGPTQSASQSASSSQSLSDGRTQSASQSASSSQSSTNGNTQSASQSASNSRSLSNGRTQSASQSASSSQSLSEVRTQSDSNSQSSTNGNTQSASQSASNSQSSTNDITQSASQSASASSSQTASNAQTQSFSQSSSDSSSNTGTPTKSYSQSRSGSKSETTSQSRSDVITQSYSRSQSHSESGSTGITQSQSDSESTSQTGPIPTESPTGTPSESPSVFIPTNSPSPGINTTQSRSAAMSKTPAPLISEPPSLGWIIGLSTAIGVLIPCCFCCVLLWGRRRRRRRRGSTNDYDD